MANHVCPNCGQEYSDTYRKCPFCEEAEAEKRGRPIRRRGGKRLCLEAELPPGGSVALHGTLSEGRCRWRQDLFHYSFNTL